MTSCMGKRSLFGVLAAILLVPVNDVSAVSRIATPSGAEALEAGSLKSISAWLKESGRVGYLAADVADAAGIPRRESEDSLEAKQRGFRSENVLRVAQVPADEKRSFLLFMVQRPEGEVYFYLSTVSDGLKKAFVFLPKHGVVGLEAGEAQTNFQAEVLYWQARISGS